MTVAEEDSGVNARIVIVINVTSHRDPLVSAKIKVSHEVDLDERSVGITDLTVTVFINSRICIYKISNGCEVLDAVYNIRIIEALIKIIKVDQADDIAAVSAHAVFRYRRIDLKEVLLC